MFIKLKLRLLSIKYELLILSYLLVEFLNSIPIKTNMNGWCTTPYILTYDLGINSRFLIGSIINIFSSYLSIDTLYFIIIITLATLCYLVSICLGKILKNTHESYKFSTFILIVFFITSPASISFLFNRANFGRLDLFLLLATITSVLLIINKKLKFLVPIICVLCLAIHQVFVFTYLIIVVIILIYDIYEENLSKSSVIITIITVIVSCVSFFYFQCYNRSIPFKDVNEFVAILKLRTNAPISYDMIKYEYFLTIKEHLSLIVYSVNNIEFPSWKERFLSGLFVIIFMLPHIIVIYKIWINGIKVTSDKNLKLIFMLMMASPLAALPVFALSIDWGRWFASVFIVQYSFIFYLIYKKCSPVIKIMKELQLYFYSNIYIIISIIAFMSIIGEFRASEILIITNRLSTSIFTIFDFL